MLRRSFFLLTLVVSLATAVAGARAAADAATDPAGFVNSLVSQGLQAVANKQLTTEQREQKFRTLLQSDFDLPRIARFVLGRYWNTASEPERQKFAQLFEEFVIRSYAQRFSEYSGESVKIVGSRPESETSTVVQSQIIRPTGVPPAKVDWRVRKDGNGYKIVDVDVEGVSMALTEREEFASVIQRSGGTVSGLNQNLQQKLASGNVGALGGESPKAR